MEHLPEFFSNHLMLFAALFVVLALLIKAEFDHLVNKGSLITPANAIRMMNNDEQALVLDVRTEAEFKQGHIKNAKNIPVAKLLNRVSEIQKYKDKPVLAYCNVGNSSTRACRLLKKSGFTQVRNLGGGINSWQDANLPLTTK